LESIRGIYIATSNRIVLWIQNTACKVKRPQVHSISRNYRSIL